MIPQWVKDAMRTEPITYSVKVEDGENYPIFVQNFDIQLCRARRTYDDFCKLLSRSKGCFRRITLIGHNVQGSEYGQEPLVQQYWND